MVKRPVAIAFRDCTGFERRAGLATRWRSVRAAEAGDLAPVRRTRRREQNPVADPDVFRQIALVEKRTSGGNDMMTANHGDMAGAFQAAQPVRRPCGSLCAELPPRIGSAQRRRTRGNTGSSDLAVTERGSIRRTEP